MKRSGCLIVLEGLDGAGTTSQMHLLAEALQESYLVHTTSEPTRGPIGQLIREYLKKADKIDKDAMALLFAADRRDHLQNEIVPALEQGKLVICDRYVFSSLVYQVTAGVSRDFVLSINQGIIIPDLTLFLEVSSDVAEERRKKRGGFLDTYENKIFQEKIQRLYPRELRSKEAGTHQVEFINGDLSKEEVFNLAFAFVQKVLINLPKRGTIHG